jgi:S-formylglutathione hydrolase FrmB
LILIGLLGTCFAIPDARDFVIGQWLYQGDIFFPVTPKHTVVRVARLPWSGSPVREVVPVRRGTIVVGQLTSAVLHGQRRAFRLYLPPGYFSAANRLRRYPVLFLLHGWPGDSTSWLRGVHPDYAADEMIAAGTVQPLIIMMPDMSGDMWRDTQCVNRPDGTDPEMSYFVRDVVPYVDAHYRTIPDRHHRALGGLSAGGYCAYNIGLHYAGVFNTLLGISAYYHAQRGEVFGFNDPFGNNPPFLAANSPDDYVARVPGVRGMHLFVVDSTADWGYTQYATRFSRELTHLGIPHVLIIRHSGGLIVWDHTWAFWRSAFRLVLPAISRSFCR